MATPCFRKPFLFRLLLMVYFSCGLTFFLISPLHAGNKIPVYVSILPQQYFVQQIGRDLVEVNVMAPPGSSPATYEPRPAQMTALKKTRIYFSIGVPFETVWLNKITAINSGIRIVHTDNGIQKRFLENHVCHHHAVNPETDLHVHTSSNLSGHIPDPHVWLSPPLVALQARTILIGLQQTDPARREIYAENYRSFLLQLMDVDDRLRRMLEFPGTGTKRFMVLHPAWGYFAHAYGLKQIPIEVEGKNPGPAQLKKIIDYARQHDLSFILAQPQSSHMFARQVAQAIDGQVVLADPLSPDWEENLMMVAKKLQAGLR